MKDLADARVDFPLRVAILAWDTPPRLSGLGRAAFEIASALRDRGCEVVLLDASLERGVRVEKDGILVVGCGSTGRIAARLRRIAGLGHLAAPLQFRRALRAEHLAKPFDIVEATNWYAPAALLDGLGMPLVVRNSTPAIDARPTTRGLRNRFDLQVAHWLESRTARGATALISNTLGHAGNITELYGLQERGDHSVVGLALDPVTIRAGAVAPPPSPDKPPQLLFVGRMERRKGFDEALDGHGLLVAERRAAGLVAPVLNIIGVTDAELAMRRDRHAIGLGESVLAHGPVDDAGLHALLSTATAVLAPSRYESYGLVYREAAAFGRPLIACAEDPAAVEFVGASGCGVLAERCDADAIATALAKVLDDRDLQAEMAAAGRRAASLLSREALADETLAVYRRAIEGRAVM